MNTLENVADEEGGEVLGKEGDEDECYHHGEGCNHCLAVADFVDYDAGCVETKDFSYECSIGECSLFYVLGRNIRGLRHGSGLPAILQESDTRSQHRCRLHTSV